MSTKKIIIGIAVVCIVLFGFFLFRPTTDTISQIPGTSVSTTSDQTAGNSAYVNKVFGFQIQPGEGFTTRESYLNQDLGPGREIPGVAFVIPAALSQGTNLSPDSYLSVEKLSDVDCTPSSFIDSVTTTETVNISGVSFEKAVVGGAGAGNLYEETVYVTEKADACFAVREFVHSTQLANYDPGTVKAFDKAKLTKLFDSMLATLVIN